MSGIFSKIATGQIPSYKIAEDDKYYAFLDINPLMEGHTLVIPKEETDYIFDLDDDTVGGLMIFAKKIAVAIKKAVPCNRISVNVWGLEVPHAHIHLIPMNRMSDVNYKKPKLKLTKEEFQAIAARIRANLI